MSGECLQYLPGLQVAYLQRIVVRCGYDAATIGRHCACPDLIRVYWERIWGAKLSSLRGEFDRVIGVVVSEETKKSYEEIDQSVINSLRKDG